MSASAKHGAIGLLALALGALPAGCGGAKPEPQSPNVPAPAFPTGTAAVPVPAAPAPEGAQPSGPMPTGPLKMNAAAQASFARGAAAYAAGDVVGARAAFQEATQADPRAYQAQYSLGVVLERMGDARAADAYRQAFTIQKDYDPAISAYANYLGTRGRLGEAESFLQSKRAELPNSAGVLAALAEIKSMQR
ncbi:MAG TPA: hypothetical protein VGL13_15795, partial [Polyangiaceae bacterium]